MIEIRTPRGRLYGMLDELSYTLYIKDGRTTRAVQVPQDSGLRLTYGASCGTDCGASETIFIPPKGSGHLYN